MIILSIKNRTSIIIDYDDVLANCNSYALELLSEENGVFYSMEDITGWGILGKPVDERFKIFKEKRFYETQPAMARARWFLNELTKRADVTIVTAVAAEFMGARIERIAKQFPEFPLDHVIMGQRKDRMKADIMIDDGLHNLLSSDCTLPILFDQPWNREISGICRVCGYDEILTLVDFVTEQKTEIDLVPKVICLVGPSGSDKHVLVDALCSQHPDQFKRIRTLTTSRANGKNSISVGIDYFDSLRKSGMLLETTFYGGHQYGTKEADIVTALASGKNAVAVMDISGCMCVYNKYPGRCKIFYVERDKRDCIMSIISKPGLTREQVTDRIMSIDFEQKNRVLADHVISSDKSLDEQVDYICEHI